MSPVVRAALESWNLEPWLILPVLILAAVYLRGWRLLARDVPGRLPGGRPAAFLSGLGLLWLAVASPLDALSPLLLQVHMTQHVLLMLLAPPLIWLGAPQIPLLRGLPGAVQKHALGPFLASPGLRRVANGVTHPVFCWLTFAVTTWTWHVPALYELALRAPAWHRVEHACFVAAGLLFWWPVIQPWPSRRRWPVWALVPYLLLAGLLNSAFSALFTFADRLFYASYAAAPRPWNVSALDDQALAGAILWVAGSVVLLVPLGALVTRLLELPGARMAARERRAPRSAARRRGGRRRFPRDVLRLPVLGRVLRATPFRRGLQTVLLLVAAAVVADGLLGPQVSPLNLAGVLPWTHWRGLLVIALLGAGNLFCMACPFMLPRELGRRWLPARWRWPRRLRSKWLAVGLLILYLWAYEALGLWQSPWWTAWIAIGYFVVAFAVDGLFRGASFCKYVCPIGQFQFVNSLVSPMEVRVRDPDACRRCKTYDCIRGNARHRGCELRLFLPRKAGNLDCTFCLDCVRACPHDNVGIMGVVPGREIARDVYRSALGRLSRRPDIAVLALVLVFGAFLNAAGMVGPVLDLEERITRAAGLDSRVWTVTLLLAPSLTLLPVALAAACGGLSRVAGGGRASWRELTCRFCVALVPLGFAMWLAHFVFHLWTGAGAVVAALERALADLGWRTAGAELSMAHAGAVPHALTAFEIAALDAGLLLTLYAAWRIARGRLPATGRALGMLAPWAALAMALYAAGIWIVFQPMQMRGTMMGMMTGGGGG